MQRAIAAILLLLLATPAFSQGGYQVNGTVTDESGLPLIGVTVMEVGTTKGTATNETGLFTLSVSSQNADVTFSYVGYTNVTLKAGDVPAAVQMGEEATSLNEVVVIGYGTVRKHDVTGSVTAIRPDKLNKGLAVNPQDMLQGKVAGVSVTSSDGTPGGKATIRIRGGSSLNASNDPLIVIDGLPVDNTSMKGVANPLALINPNDIETFTVLKDASATAIYGSRASNGVILITTKRGVVGSKPVFSYNGSVSVSTLAKRIEVMDAAELIQYAKDLKLYDENKQYFGASNTDWQDEIYRSAVSTDHNFSVSGGYKGIPYRVGMGYTYQDGILKTSNMQRGTVSASVNPTFLDNHLTLNVTGKAMYIGNRWADNNAVGAALGMDPTQSVYDNSDAGKNYGGYTQNSNTFDIDPAWPTTYNTQAIKNPVATLELKDDRSKTYELVGNIQAAYKVHGLEDLTLNASLAGEYGEGTQHTKNSPYSAESHYYGWDGTDTKERYNVLFNAFAQYTKDIKDDFHFDIMAGYEYQHMLLERGNLDGWGMFPATNPETPNTRYNEKHEKYAHQKYLLSFFGRANLSYKDRYLLTLTMRSDGSSNFRKEDRFGYFPSVALAWKIKEESFLKDVDILSDLKLRLGYGITGQQDIGQGDAPYLPILETNKEGSHSFYPLGEENGKYIFYKPYRPTAINRALTWETTATYNAGIDFGFLKQRFTASFEYYHRVTDNLISQLDIPGGTNFKNRTWANIGSLSNTGFEFTFDGRIIQSKDLTWSLSFNATYNVNKITKLAASDNPDYYVATGGISSGTGNNIQAQKVGYPAWSFLVYETAVDENGEYYFVDRSGPDGKPDGVIDSKDMYCYKSRMAPLTLGFSSALHIKKFDVSIAMRANIGNYMYNDHLASNLKDLQKANLVSSKIGGFHNVPKQAYDTYWIDEFKADAPGMKGQWYLSDYLVQDASFLRIDKVTVGYSIKREMRVYATVQNPIVVTGYKGLDPERFEGIDNNTYPRSLTVLLGLTYDF
ncbi:MAG: TonB-dependent receptor [Prevotellaceae bacterium]|jgi:iron complex outermembrane receptor protein|nr:TonB-dependent receptor [Prevotellaceae bacterium]